QPDPLEILIELPAPAELSRIVVYETAVGDSHEIYNLFVSDDGRKFQKVGSAGKGTRGTDNFVTHQFTKRKVHSIKIMSQGCHGLTFPSFSRLCEVMAFSD
ncbi:MAG: hypothetical protein ACR2RV_02005, partial [Verrucomicrobiales bacterium]